MLVSMSARLTTLTERTHGAFLSRQHSPISPGSTANTGFLPRYDLFVTSPETRSDPLVRLFTVMTCTLSVAAQLQRAYPG